MSRDNSSSIADEYKDQLNQDGFAIIEEVIDAASVEHLRQALSSCEKNNSGRQRRGSMFAIRNLLDVAPDIRGLAESEAIRSLIEPLLMPDAFVVRAIFFDKTPEANWTVSWHQDVTIAVQERIDTPGFGPWSIKQNVQHVRPPDEVLAGMLTIRVHLDDCDVSNGALQVIPGSHRSGSLEAEELSDCRDRNDITYCNVSAGGAVLMKPLIAHASSPGHRPGHRRVIHLEFAADPLPPPLSWHRA